MEHRGEGGSSERLEIPWRVRVMTVALRTMICRFRFTPIGISSLRRWNDGLRTGSNRVKPGAARSLIRLGAAGLELMVGELAAEMV